QAPSVFFKKRLDQLGVVDKGIIQYHHDFSGGIFPQPPLQKTEEGRCVVCPFFCTNDPTGFIIQGAYQFYPFVLSISGDFSLVAAEKPGAANGFDSFYHWCDHRCCCSIIFLGTFKRLIVKYISNFTYYLKEQLFAASFFV
ncbi:hypothetical protein A5827_000891, partial [Enterococcus faecium]